MVTEITSEDFTAQSSDTGAEEAALQTARAKAMAEINALQAQASTDDQARSANAHYSRHEAPGFGTYVIPRRTGWKPLLDIIHDPVPNIDFSANIYPNFDGIIGDHFQSPYLLDPLDDKYESYESLRDNLAAVRNFLLQTYYSNTPDAMSSEKARQSLTEIAGFVGDGLYNNWLFLGLVPNHNPTKPFIDLSEARKPGGRGAQYIYEKILEHQKHSSWLRPFDAVIALLGGKTAPDWKLPPASTTHFDDYLGEGIAADAQSAEETALALENANGRLVEIEARLNKLYDSRAVSTTASDLDALGNQLIYTVQNMQGVAHINESDRIKAVALAKDILNKLKLGIGTKNTIDGLNMQPSDDMAVLGAVKGVAMVYERLLAWARGNNDNRIFQNPAVSAAARAIGQIGYLAKLEARRMAVLANNTVMAASITEQIKRLPEAYTRVDKQTFSALFDTIEHGLDTVLNRVQEVGVSGAKIGKSVDNRGTSMDAPPTVGSATGLDDAAQRNAQLIAAQQLAAMAQAQRNAKNDTNRQANTTQTTGVTATGRTGSARANTQQRQQRTSTSATTNINVAQQQEAARRSANFAAAHAHDHEDQHHHHDDQLRQQWILQQQQKAREALQAKAAVKAAAAKVTNPAGAKFDASIIKGVNLKVFDMKGVTGSGEMLKPGRSITPQDVMKPTVKSQMTGATPIDPNHPLYPQQPNGRGRY